MDKPEVLQLGPYPDWDQGPLDAAFVMHRLFEDPALLPAVGPQVRAIAARGTHSVPSEMIAACPHLELIAVYGVGYDGVDLEAARARGIAVTNTPNVLTGDVADLGIAMMLAARRGVVGAEAWVRDGTWTGAPYPLQRRVFGAKVGVLGLGRIGREVVRRLSGFDMEIAFVDPVAEAGGLTRMADAVALANWSDILFVTLAATADTRGIVDRAVMEALGPEGLLINISRAANVDEAALIEALTRGTLGAAALDVFEGEPNLDPRLLECPNLMVQPHHASGTVESRKAMGQLLRDNLTAHFAGRPLLTPV